MVRAVNVPRRLKTEPACGGLCSARHTTLYAAGKENDCIILHFIGRGAVPFGTESIFAEGIESYQRGFAFCGILFAEEGDAQFCSVLCRAEHRDQQKCQKINKRYKRQQGENKFEFVLRQNNRNDDG